MSTAGNVHLAAQEQQRGVNRLGLVIFIMSEAVLFANLIAAYLYLRYTSAQWPPAGTPHLEIAFPAVNTVILLGSGIPMHWAHKSVQAGNRRSLLWGLALTIVLGTAFLLGQAWEYATAGFTPQTNVFGSSFFTLTGFHGAHVLVGLTFLAVVLALSLRGRFSPQSHFAVEASALYWHFVDAVWVALFAVLYVL